MHSDNTPNVVDECVTLQGDDMKTVKIDGIVYAPVQPNGNRAVVVIDRGWIYAGDVIEKDGRIYLDRAVWVFRWEKIGFAAVIDNPKQSGVDIRPMTTVVDIPAGAEVFRCPVSDDWGL
jgi:hypothetical protein